MASTVIVFVKILLCMILLIVMAKINWEERYVAENTTPVPFVPNVR